MNGRIIPVVVINDVHDTERILGSLVSGGIGCAEITYRTECASEAIRIGKELFPDMNIGAGTVINKAQCAAAIAAGASFVVSPGLSDEVFYECKSAGVPYYPGCVTPTEIMHAISLGIDIVKFFPANIYGGLKAIKALSAPFPNIKFIPTGGVDLSNLAEFLSCDKVYAVGGSFMMKGDITANCKEIMKICASLPSEK